MTAQEQAAFDLVTIQAGQVYATLAQAYAIIHAACANGTEAQKVSMGLVARYTTQAEHCIALVGRAVE